MKSRLFFISWEKLLSEDVLVPFYICAWFLRQNCPTALAEKLPHPWVWAGCFAVVSSQIAMINTGSLSLLCYSNSVRMTASVSLPVLRKITDKRSACPSYITWQKCTKCFLFGWSLFIIIGSMCILSLETESAGATCWLQHIFPLKMC